MSGLIFFLRAAQADVMGFVAMRMASAWAEHEEREILEWMVEHA